MHAGWQCIGIYCQIRSNRICFGIHGHISVYLRCIDGVNHDVVGSTLCSYCFKGSTFIIVSFCCRRIYFCSCCSTVYIPSHKGVSLARYLGISISTIFCRIIGPLIPGTAVFDGLLFLSGRINISFHKYKGSFPVNCIHGNGGSIRIIRYSITVSIICGNVFGVCIILRQEEQRASFLVQGSAIGHCGYSLCIVLIGFIPCSICLVCSSRIQCCKGSSQEKSLGIFLRCSCCAIVICIPVSVPAGPCLRSNLLTNSYGNSCYRIRLIKAGVTIGFAMILAVQVYPIGIGFPCSIQVHICKPWRCSYRCYLGRIFLCFCSIFQAGVPSKEGIAFSGKQCSVVCRCISFIGVVIFCCSSKHTINSPVLTGSTFQHLCGRVICILGVITGKRSSVCRILGTGLCIVRPVSAIQIIGYIYRRIFCSNT